MSDAHGHSPLAQFEIHPVFPLHIGDYNVSFTNSSAWTVVACALALLLFTLGSLNRRLVPGRTQSLAEMVVEFVRNTIKDSAGYRGLKYFPFVFTLFVFILFANLSGMLPFSFTVTSHIIVTFALAISVFLWTTAVNIKENGIVSFVAHFVPLDSSTPKIIKILLGPLLFVIEIFSFLARPCSLSIRLAANMMAGHTLLKVIAGFIYPMSVLGVLPLALTIGLVGFEIGIAILQAYIFTVLTCVYLSDAFQHSH